HGDAPVVPVRGAMVERDLHTTPADAVTGHNLPPVANAVAVRSKTRARVTTAFWGGGKPEWGGPCSCRARALLAKSAICGSPNPSSGWRRVARSSRFSEPSRRVWCPTSRRGAQRVGRPVGVSPQQCHLAAGSVRGPRLAVVLL